MDPLYARVLGERFDELPERVRSMHAVHGRRDARGEGIVTAGCGRIARLVCRLMGFPPTGGYPIHVSFVERNGTERWTRRFGDYRFSSVLKQCRAGVGERFGPMRLDFDVPSDAQGLRMIVRRWSLLGIPLPLLLAPRIEAREWQEADRFRFSVKVAMRGIGPVITYEGWLEPTDAQ
jgi:hypothetical protein